MQSVSLGIFLKTPRAGRVKTRLATSIGEEQAVSLYTSFLSDTVTLALNASARHLLLWSDDRPASEFLTGQVGERLRACGPGHLTELRQSPGDLGLRLATAWSDAAARDRDRLLMLGSDSPDLPATHLERALEALAGGAEVVLGPAEDGGVWCIGLSRAVPGFFDDLPWSEAHTGEALGNRAQVLAVNEGVDGVSQVTT